MNERLSLNVVRSCARVCVLLNCLSLKTKQTKFPGGPHAICIHEAEIRSPAHRERDLMDL